MTATTEQGPVEEMRGKLLRWLGDSNATPATLLEWLEGYDLPGVDRDDDNKFLWIVRALPSDGDRERVIIRLAKRLSGILGELEQGSWNRPPSVLRNLLLLCANLRRPQELAEPLWLLFVPLRGLNKFPSPWDGEARGALRSALAANQIDSRLRDVWVAMVCGTRDLVLLGNRLDGWHGLSRCVEALGKPDMDAIGLGLGGMALYFDHQPDKRIRFRRLIKDTKSYHGSADFNRRLIYQADQNHWPPWAVECLTLYEEIQPATTEPEQPINALAWSKSLSAVPPDYFNRRKDLCCGVIVDVEIPRQRIEHVRTVVKRVSDELDRNPSGSERSVTGTVRDVLEEIELFVKNNQTQQPTTWTLVHLCASWFRLRSRKRHELDSQKEIAALQKARSNLKIA